MSEKNIPVFADGNGQFQVQVGWAGEEVDGGRPIELNDEFQHAKLTNVWYGEPDPNPEVTAEVTAAAVKEAEETQARADAAKAQAEADAQATESQAEVHDQPEPTDSAPIEVPVTDPPVVDQPDEEE